MTSWLGWIRLGFASFPTIHTLVFDAKFNVRVVRCTRAFCQVQKHGGNDWTSNLFPACSQWSCFFLSWHLRIAWPTHFREVLVASNSLSLVFPVFGRRTSQTLTATSAAAPVGTPSSKVKNIVLFFTTPDVNIKNWCRSFGVSCAIYPDVSWLVLFALQREEISRQDTSNDDFVWAETKCRADLSETNFWPVFTKNLTFSNNMGGGGV